MLKKMLFSHNKHEKQKIEFFLKHLFENYSRRETTREEEL